MPFMEVTVTRLKEPQEDIAKKAQWKKEAQNESAKTSDKELIVPLKESFRLKGGQIG